MMIRPRRTVGAHDAGAGLRFVVGVDEAGRGPLAGPLAVAAVMAPQITNRKSQIAKVFLGVRDSKQLSEKEREEWFFAIGSARAEGLLDYSVSFVSSTVIDARGLSFALRAGVTRSLKKLQCDSRESVVLLDGALSAPQQFLQETIIRGDETVLPITLAGIVAKVLRDRKMRSYAKRFPKYGFERHKGYGTLRHQAVLQRLGPSPIHRLSFLGSGLPENRK